MRDSILLLAAACIAFGLSLAGSFHFDDYSLFSDPDLISLSATRPLTNLTFHLNAAAGGRDPIGYHAVNLLLHAAAVLLLASTLRRIVTPPVALLAALLFAVHPIQTEPVNYVFARGTLLATLLCIAALRAWLLDRPWIAVVLFAAALLAKEECVAFPLFLLLFDLSRGRAWKQWRPIAAMIAVALAAGLRVIAATAAIPGTATGFTALTSPLLYLSVQGIAILRYLRLIVFPWGFSIDPELPVPDVWIRLIAWIGVIGLAAFAAWSFPRLQAGFWSIGGLVLLLPSSSIFPADDYAADRRMYLPMVALSVAIALLVQRLDRRIIGVALVALAATSVRYSYVWQTEQRLWTEAAALAPHKARPLLQLSRAAATPEAALAILDRAARLAPDDPAIPTEQGRMDLLLGRPADALAAFGRALSLAPADPMTVSNRGAALMALGQLDAARADFTRALRLDPCQFNARVNLKHLGTPAATAPQCHYTAEQRDELER